MKLDEVEKAMLRDWHLFCRGEIERDTSDFLMLFAIDLSPSQLREIVSYFPHADMLLKRLERVFNISSRKTPGVFPRIENRGSKEDLLKYAVLYLEEQRRICIELGEDEIAETISHAKPLYTNDVEIFDEILMSRDIPNNELFEIVGDYLGTVQILNDRKTYALFEAYYGFRANYHLAWYLGAPLLKTDLIFDYYFDFWSRGGEYVLTKDALLVRHMN